MTRPQETQARAIQEIQRLVAEHYQVSESYMRGRSRKPGVAQARQVAMYAARTMTGCTLRFAAAMFALRDHSTVLYATRTVAARIAAGRPDITLALAICEEALAKAA